MTEERRKMIEILKEVDDFFQQCGVYEAVEAFIHSEEVTNRVEEASAQLITNLQKMEDDAPNDEIRGLALEARTDFESDHASFVEDILSTFKVSFSSALHLISDMTDDTLRPLLIDSVKTVIPRKGMMDINDICATLVEMYSNEFMLNIYRDYVPDDMPDAIASFIRTFFGDIIIPVDGRFPDENLVDSAEKDS